MNEDSVVAHSTLYGFRPGEGLRLYGQRCKVCGRVAFPRASYGCEGCGAHGDSLESIDLTPEGHLISFAEVHRYQGDDIETPFIIGRIQLSDGPCIRCTLANASVAGLQAGLPVRGVLKRVRASAGGPPELQFQAGSL